MVRGYGSIISGKSPAEIHHCIGRTAKIKIDLVSENIGHFFILPLTHEEHKMIDQGTVGLTVLKAWFVQKNFINSHDAIQLNDLSLHEFEKHLFKRMTKRLAPNFDKKFTEGILAWTR